MKIEIDDWGCCLSTNCPFSGECSVHGSAGDFRSEEGFRPQVYKEEGQLVCMTSDRRNYEEGTFEGTFMPDNVDELNIGFFNLNNAPTKEKIQLAIDEFEDWWELTREEQPKNTFGAALEPALKHIAQQAWKAAKAS